MLKVLNLQTEDKGLAAVTVFLYTYQQNPTYRLQLLLSLSLCGFFVKVSRRNKALDGFLDCSTALTFAFISC